MTEDEKRKKTLALQAQIMPGDNPGVTILVLKEVY